MEAPHKVLRMKPRWCGRAGSPMEVLVPAGKRGGAEKARGFIGWFPK